MSIWDALILGIIQGVTEFLPISSSGHLALGQYFLGFDHQQDHLIFNLVCHLGTLCAIFFVYFSYLQDNFKFQKKHIWNVVIGTIPLIPLVAIIKPLKQLFGLPQILGPCFLFSACLLFGSFYWQIPSFLKKERRGWTDPLIIGFFQAVAIFPGISRSGATVSAARFLNWSTVSALQFSLLLAIPAILGGVVLESWEAFHRLQSIEYLWPLIVGFLTSFFVGSFSLVMLVRLTIQDKWIYFAWYCLLLGTVTTLYFNIFN